MDTIVNPPTLREVLDDALRFWEKRRIAYNLVLAGRLATTPVDFRTGKGWPFEYGPVGIALVDVRSGSRGRYLTVNRALCEITGYSEEDLLTTSRQALTHPMGLLPDSVSCFLPVSSS